MKIMIINGPNINMLGIRERNIYGDMNYEEMCDYIKNYPDFKKDNLEINFFQSNIEGEIVNFIQRAFFEKYDGIVINPAAYTHTSVAIYDAIKAVNLDTIEVHISNIYQREEFRKKSIVAPACKGQISGLGVFGYILAIQNFLKK